MEIIVLKNAGMFQRGFNQRLGTGFGIFLQQMPLQRPGIDPDPHRASMITRRPDHFAHPVLLADIAGVDPQAGRTGLGSLDGAAVVEMDIGDNRHRAFGADLAKGAGAVLIRTGHAHNVGTGLGGRIDLRQRPPDIGGQRIGHGLHRNRRVAADRHRPHHDLTAASPLDCPVGSVGVGHGQLS